MAPIPSEVDYLVIGGGSGGVASARRAGAVYDQKVLVVENKRWGGTCVNVGCVPKKITWHAADIAEKIKYGKAYGFEIEQHAPFDWRRFKEKRDAYIQRLNGIYEKNLEADKAIHVHGTAKFIGERQVEITLEDGSKTNVKGSKVLIATGGYPNVPEDVEGALLGITSDGFFELEKQPKRVAIVGAGYIAVEFAGMFNALGSESHLFIRHDKFLRSFDPMIQDKLDHEYRRQGIHLHTQSSQSKIEDMGNGVKRIHYKDSNGSATLDVDALVWAVGRNPELKSLDVDKIGIKTDERGHIVVDEFQNTNIQDVFAIGDVCNRGFELTPVAIAAGRRLADRLFGGQADKRLIYDNIPSVIFSHPTAGAIGMTEPIARQKYGDTIKIYNSRFISMFNSMCDSQEDKVESNYKLICEGANERVVGLHIVGEGSDEILQGFGVAIKMGATKADFDGVVAIHPTSAEELVTLK